MTHSPNGILNKRRGKSAICQHWLAEDFSSHLPNRFFREELERRRHCDWRNPLAFEVEVLHRVNLAWGFETQVPFGIEGLLFCNLSLID